MECEGLVKAAIVLGKFTLVPFIQIVVARHKKLGSKLDLDLASPENFIMPGTQIPDNNDNVTTSIHAKRPQNLSFKQKKPLGKHH